MKTLIGFSDGSIKEINGFEELITVDPDFLHFVQWNEDRSIITRKIRFPKTEIMFIDEKACMD